MAALLGYNNKITRDYRGVMMPSYRASFIPILSVFLLLSVCDPDGSSTKSGTNEGVSLSCSPLSVSESSGASTCVLSLSSVASREVIVNVIYSGTATAGIDYVGNIESHTIAAGTSSIDWVVTGTNDAPVATVEGSETVVIDIDSVVNSVESGIQQQTVTIEDDAFVVTAPDGGESWQQGSTYTIKWGTESIVGDVSIELRTGSGTSGATALEIATETPNDGSYDWKIPTTVDKGSDYTIRIRSLSNMEKIVTSDSTFTITETSLMTFSSSAFSEGGLIPEKYTCDGSEASLPFTYSGISNDAKELVLFLDDLDGTPTSTITTTDFNHWVVTGIPVSSSFSDYVIPAGAVEGKNGSGDLALEPICPPGSKGDRVKHTYRFTLHALDKNIVNNSSTRSEIVTAMEGAILQKKTLTGYFESP